MKLKSLIDVSKDIEMAPMTKEQTEGFVLMSMLDVKQPDVKYPIDDQSPFALRIMEGRLEWAGIADKVAFPVKLFLGTLCDRPAKSVMWAYTLAHMLELDNQKINMSVITKYFPMGFPSEELQEKCWDDQKGFAHGVRADNLMDIKEWWEK